MADNPTVNGIPVAADDVGGVMHQLVLMEYGPADNPVRVTTGAPLPTVDSALTALIGALSSPASGSVNNQLAAILARLSTDPSTGTKQDAQSTRLDTLIAKDYATQTTLAAVLGRLAGATPVYAAANTTDVSLSGSAGRLMSFSARETTGSAGASFYLRDGSGGTIITIVTLAAGESIRDTFAPNGVTLTTGLYLDRITGSSEVAAAVS
jgi:hypothetical protein